MDEPPQRRARRPARQGSALQPTELDRRLLEMAAEHRVVVPGHVAVHLGCSIAAAAARLQRLTTARLMRRQPLGYHLITARGLRAVGSGYRAPQPDDNQITHDAGLAWVWLAARSGVYGPMREVVSERRMRSADAVSGGLLGRSRGATPAAPELTERYAVRLGGFGASGRERLHYPDLLLVTPQGHRIAFELELGTKERTRRETILAGYGGDPRIDAVVYLVDRPAVGRAIRESARRLGISSLVHVQPVRFAPGALPPAVERGASRAPAAERLGVREEAVR